MDSVDWRYGAVQLPGLVVSAYAVFSEVAQEILMKRFLVIMVLAALALVGCAPPGDNSRNRVYSVDCGNAQTIGSGSCGLTVTGVGWGQ